MRKDDVEPTLNNSCNRKKVGESKKAGERGLGPGNGVCNHGNSIQRSVFEAEESGNNHRYGCVGIRCRFVLLHRGKP